MLQPQRKKPTDGIRKRTIRRGTLASADVAKKKRIGYESSNARRPDTSEVLPADGGGESEDKIVVTEWSDNAEGMRTKIVSGKNADSSDGFLHEQERSSEGIDQRMRAAGRWLGKLKMGGGSGGVADDSPMKKPVERKGGAQRRGRGFRIGIACGFLAAAVVVIALSTLFYSASISIVPHQEQQVIDAVTIALDASLSGALIEQRVIPAELLTFSRSVSDEFKSTGNKFIEEKARGTVRVYNQFSSSPQALVEKTRFLTDTGVLYRLPSAIRVPGAKIEEGRIIPQYIEVELVADEAGEGSNLSGELRLSIPGFAGSPKYEGFYGMALDGFAGGYRGESPVVSADDRTGAQEAVTKRVYDELRQEIARKVPPDFRIIDALNEIEIRSVSVSEEGARALQFSAEATADAKSFVFRDEDVLSVLNAHFYGESSDKIIMPDTADVQYQVRALDFDQGSAELVVRGSVKVQAVIPGQRLALDARGKKEGSLSEMLKARQDIAQFSVSIFPPWRSSVPEDTDKIIVIIEESGE